MPRRRRPPLTTLEIGAYTAGSRLHGHWVAAGNLGNHQLWALEVMANDDALIMCSMGARRWWRWFERGWDDDELAGWAK